jgi:acyl-CoA synthetase (AMP-forming)/AMP-acid ligase II
MTADGQPAALGEEGELWVMGPQVCRGYLHAPELSAQKITEDDTHGRIFKTGDIVRQREDGEIVFVGRRDGMVKIRGFRVELKEVEAVIREFPGIKDATVHAFDTEGEGGGKYIAAYVVSDTPVDIEALHAFVRDKKPPYMVPEVTMQIDAIPMNQNQKVDKRALPKPVRSAATESQQTEQPPQNVLEKELHEIISKLVGNSDFGITTVLGRAGITPGTLYKS